MNQSILSNLVTTLSQIKLQGQDNVPVVIDHQQKTLSTLTLAQYATLTVQEWSTMPIEGGQITVTFHLDVQRTSVAFSENTTANPDRFYTAAGRVFYMPDDTKLNGAAGISTIAAQPIYYITVEQDGWQAQGIYDNRRNLLFGRVLVSTKAEPKAFPNENVACLVPIAEAAENHESSDFIQYETDTYDLYLWMDFAVRAGLSEEDDLIVVQTAVNAVRTALMIDRFRGGASTWQDADRNGTAIPTVVFPPSKDFATAKLQIQCPHMRGYQGETNAMIITTANRDTAILQNIMDTLMGITDTGDEYGAFTFEQVIVATKKNPPFAQNANQAIVVPAGEKTANSETNDTIQYTLADFDVYVQLNALNWGNLSELERVQRGNEVENEIKTALYADKSRGGVCTFYDRDLNGTQVEKMQLLESGTTLKGVCRVKCCYMAVEYQY